MNNCCCCPPIGRSPKRALPQMNIWKKRLGNGSFCTQNVNKIDQTNFWDYIDMLGRDFERKNSSIGHSSPQHHPEWFTSAYRGSSPCAIFHNPDKKDILHSNVLPNLVLKVWTKVFDFMTKLQLPNLHQTAGNTFLSINISNSNSLSKFWVGIFRRQGHINQVY